MRILFLFSICVQLSIILYAQNKALDYAASDTWPNLKPVSISNNGKYVIFTISSNKGETKWTVEATDHSLEMNLFKIKDILFTQDNRFLIFLNVNDSLGILDLARNELNYTAHVRSIKLPSGGSGRWAAFLLREPYGVLVLKDLLSGDERRYSMVGDFIFDSRGKSMLLQLNCKYDSMNWQAMRWIDLSSGIISNVGCYSSADRFVFNEEGNQLAFLSRKFSNNRIDVNIIYYREGMSSALTIVDSTTQGTNGMIVKDWDMEFSKEGDKLFFRMEKSGFSRSDYSNHDSVPIDVKNSQSEILYARDYGIGYLAVTDLKKPGYIIRLENDSDFVSYYPILDKDCDEDFLLTQSVPARKVNVYSPIDQLRRDLCLVSTKDGSRKLIDKNSVLYNVGFSLNGKYVIWYDEWKKQWNTYRKSDGCKKNITKNIPVRMYRDDDDVNNLSREEGIACWLKADRSLLIYDSYDIWKVDPDGRQKPINMTNGYGRKNGIRFRYMNFEGSLPTSNYSHHSKYRPKSDTLILEAFDLQTKQNGFFSLTMGRREKLKKLIFGKNIYYYSYRFSPPTILGATQPMFPLKAKSVESYVVQRQNINDYPNLYITRDFINFRALTSFQPQRNYIWFSSELIHFTLSNGWRLEGILYKPDDFTPKKKYPIIFYYYERNADALNLFLSPELSNGTLNVAWFVSNGYLVFVPDIRYYKHGFPGNCAFEAVNSAADVLSRLPFINAKQMGLQGHSFGGWETNYIVSLTNRFAAAASSGGACDLVSLNNEYNRGRSDYFESGQGRIAASLWKKPELYIHNSPIFKADKVNTPLLILHNRNDSSVPFMQANEWFNSLSHLQKRVWLLSYADEDHGLYSDKNKLDYSIRLAQFFDHFLEGAPEPAWMNEK